MILAQGAQHIDPPRLKQIIDLINSERREYAGEAITPKEIAARNQLADVYGLKDFRHSYDVMPKIYCHQGYVVEEKFDGYSYLNDASRFLSKRLSQAKGNEGMPVDKTDHVPHLAEILRKAALFMDMDLHGEIYVPGGISDDVTKILGCDEDEAQRRIQNNWDNRPRYMLIDIRRYNGKILINEPWYIRRVLLEYVYRTYIAPYDVNGDIHVADILTGDPRDEFRRIVAAGGEGLILKRTDALYMPDKKPRDNWIKCKKKITLDVVITGFNDGTGKNKSLFGSIKFGIYIDGKLTECGNCSSGLNDTTRQMIAANPEQYIGTVMEIEAIQESVKSFRNAVFLRLRDDKAATECTPDGITIKYDL